MILGAILTSQVATISTAQLKTNTAIPPMLKPTIQQLVNAGQPKDVIVTVVRNVAQGINSQQPGNAPGGPPTHPSLDVAAITHATGAILDDAQMQGTRDAGLFAAIFVFLGALSSLLIPNPGKSDMNDHYDQNDNDDLDDNGDVAVETRRL